MPFSPQRYHRRHLLQACALLMASASALAATATPPAAHHVLVLGDSLSAEYGLARGTGWVRLLEQRLQQEFAGTRVTNASISGDTTAGGRARLPALLQQHQPSVVVIELGSNDALRGLPLSHSQANLVWMTQAAQAAGAQVLLVGMQMPPNYGRQYAQSFSQLYADVAQQHGAALLPFLLAGVADGADPTALFQADRMHPSEKAQPLLLANVWPVLRPLLAPAGKPPKQGK